MFIHITSCDQIIKLHNLQALTGYGHVALAADTDTVHPQGVGCESACNIDPLSGVIGIQN